MEILKIGDQSPTFEGLDQNNKAVSSNDFNVWEDDHNI